MLKFGDLFYTYYESEDSMVIGEVKLDILKLLAELRVLNIYQLVDFMKLDNPEIKRENVYFHLQGLKKAKLIQQDDLPTNHRVKYYFLTKKGLGVLGSEYKPFKTPMYQLAHTKAVNDHLLLWCQLMYEYGVNWEVDTERAKLHRLTEGEKTGTKYQLEDFAIFTPKRGEIRIEVELTQKTIKRYVNSILYFYAKKQINVLYITPLNSVLEIIDEFKDDWREKKPELDLKTIQQMEKDINYMEQALNLWKINSELKSDINDEHKKIDHSLEPKYSYTGGFEKDNVVTSLKNRKRRNELREKNEQILSRIKKIENERLENYNKLIANYSNWEPTYGNSMSKIERDYEVKDFNNLHNQSKKIRTLIEEYETKIQNDKQSYEITLEYYNQKNKGANCIQSIRLKDAELEFRKLIEEGINYEQ